MGPSLLANLFIYSLLLFASPALAGYGDGDEAAYVTAFPTIVSASYSESLPSDLISACANLGSISWPLTQINVTQNTNAAGLQTLCGTNSVCVIYAGVTVTLDGNVNVAALINRGTIIWSDTTQTSASQWICGGYIVTEANGIWNQTITNMQKKSYIYLKDNGGKHSANGIRTFGGWVGGATIQGYPYVSVAGAPRRRTWSLLILTAPAGSNQIKLMHDVASMGWVVGDRIGIAPTVSGSNGDGQAFFIKAIDGNHIYLATDATLATNATLNQQYLGNADNHMQAEVNLMSRNVIITGDNLKIMQCGDAAGICPCRNPGTSCTMGMHTMVNGNQQRFGGTYRIQYTRVEKCGQRGILGRYCIHFHLMRDCPNCLAKGNAVEFSHQRGIVVHGTHLTTVTQNALWNVRGAGIYIEDGNELFNYITYNSVLCNNALNGPYGGCTVPDTDNGDSDGANNQASYWSAGHTTHFIGNRASNSFNGIFFDTQVGGNGRGEASGHVCTGYTALGRFEGNTCHGHGRFGTYFVASDWPRQIHPNLTANGFTTTADCSAFDANGIDRGQSSAITNNYDYHNTFIGGYAFGDIQFRNHQARSSNCLIYHKETKNFNDGCSAHFQNYLFQDGSALIAGGYGTQIFSNCTFAGNFNFETTHHCSLDEGMLCNPNYVFENPNWQSTSPSWLTWNDGNNPTHGASYSLAPPDAANPNGGFLPPGFQSLCHGIHTWLLALDGGGTCVTSASLGMATQYENGILCTKPLRRFEIFTQNVNAATAGTLTIMVSKNGVFVTNATMFFMSQSGGSKQGYTIPIVASLDYQYRVVRAGGVPTSWIIDFSDTIFANRYGAADQIRLTVDGRSCPSITTSQHDRRWIYSSANNGDYLTVTGRGACSSFPDMPVVNCAKVPPPALMSCPELCTGCNGPNQYCDCGSAQCMCTPGFSGDNCSADICASARCGQHGFCTSRYLGGDLPVTAGACVCEPPWTGPTCEDNPCDGQTCSYQGVCQAQGPFGHFCQCFAGFTGPNCENTCNGFCGGNGGNFPYSCSTGQNKPSFCNRGGGCAYGNNNNFQDPNWCCFAFCDVCIGVTCETPDNDCLLPGYCVNGTCTKPAQAPDGSICNSQVWGTCIGGVCVGHDGPVVGGPTPPVTPAPVRTPAPTRAPTVKPTPTPTPTRPPGSPPAQGYLRGHVGGVLVGVDEITHFPAANFSSYALATLFNFVILTTGGIGIQTAGSHLYCSADNGGATALVCNRQTAAGWESFNFAQQGSEWTIQAQANNKYLSVLPAGNNSMLIANVATGGTVPNSALFAIEVSPAQSSTTGAASTPAATAPPAVSTGAASTPAATAPPAGTGAGAGSGASTGSDAGAGSGSTTGSGLPIKSSDAPALFVQMYIMLAAVVVIFLM